ncbi:MAG: 3-isopropylmalate dehydratase small subunit [Synergistaceae bacterium]|jgi:3-isopropylmalate/(R)-2-methylmalate dehydratase small subunit|nr:3-isopropylmalate dehydratase small subunit [Synergistaceae bacterium]
MENIIRGKVWKHGKVDTADIISTKIWLENLNNLDPDILGKHAMAPIDKEFASRAMRGDFRIIVSGKNFGGGGKSFEHGVIALKAVGIVLVVAESFARYNFRNSINNGLPVLECNGIFNAVEAGDEIEADLSTGVIKNLTSGAALQADPLPEFVLGIMEAGSYTAYIREQLRQTGTNEANCAGETL